MKLQKWEVHISHMCLSQAISKGLSLQSDNQQKNSVMTDELQTNFFFNSFTKEAGLSLGTEQLLELRPISQSGVCKTSQRRRLTASATLCCCRWSQAGAGIAQRDPAPASPGCCQPQHGKSLHPIPEGSLCCALSKGCSMLREEVSKAGERHLKRSCSNLCEFSFDVDFFLM